MKSVLRAALFSLIFVAGAAPARQVEGVNVPDAVTLPGVNTPLPLNGAGIRYKFIVKVYVGALYLPAPMTSANAVLDAASPSSVRMFFLHDEVSAAKLVSAWNDGFASNQSAETLKTLQPRIDQFNALFPTVHSGDVVRLDYIPAVGTQVWVNDTLRGTIPGTDFRRAMLAIWLGDEPADRDLKKAMLNPK